MPENLNLKLVLVGEYREFRVVYALSLTLVKFRVLPK